MEAIMGDTTPSANGGNFLFSWPFAAPQNLTQPINPGWTFGNVIVNETNSRAPNIEQAIVAKESYGRQIGLLLEAVSLLVKDREEQKAFNDLLKLHRDVEAIKREASLRRLDQIEHDLEVLKKYDQDAYRKKMRALRKLLSHVHWSET
jgi:hypothetical protein